MIYLPKNCFKKLLLLGGLGILIGCGFKGTSKKTPVLKQSTSGPDEYMLDLQLTEFFKGDLKHKISANHWKKTHRTSQALHWLKKPQLFAVRGDAQLNADHLIVFRDPLHPTFNKMIAHGQPVVIKNTDITGTAKTLEYSSQTDQISLIDGAEVTEGQNRISGPKLVYRFQDKVLISMPMAGQKTKVTFYDQS